METRAGTGSATYSRKCSVLNNWVRRQVNNKRRALNLTLPALYDLCDPGRRHCSPVLAGRPESAIDSLFTGSSPLLFEDIQIGDDFPELDPMCSD